MLGRRLNDKKQNNWAINKTKVKDAGQHVARLKWNSAGITMDKRTIWGLTQQWRSMHGNKRHKI